MARLYKRKKNGKEAKFWTVSLWVNGNKFQRSTGKPSRRDAQKSIPGIKAEIIDELERETQSDNLTLDTMFGKYWNDHAHRFASSYTTSKHIERLLSILDGNLPLAELSNKHIADYVAKRSKFDISNTTVNRELEVLRAAYIRARDHWEHAVKPVHWKRHLLPEPDDRMVYLSLDEAKALLKHLPGHIAAAVEFAIYTGTRLNELATLTWPQIDFSEQTANVMCKRKRGQGIRWRKVYLNDQAIALLANLSSNNEGQVFNLTNRRHHWEYARSEIGRPDIRWHDLRATHAVYLRLNGVDMFVVQRALGHEQIQTTQRYSRVQDFELRQAVSKLPSLQEPEPPTGTTTEHAG